MIRNFLRNFMLGRYGPDQLGTALILLSLIISLVFRAFRLDAGSYVSIIPLLLAILRMLSRNISARRRENDRFLHYWAPVKNGVKKQWKALRSIKTHKFFKCPACKNTLRVPRGRGKLQITCPRCGERFIKKS